MERHEPAAIPRYGVAPCVDASVIARNAGLKVEELHCTLPDCLSVLNRSDFFGFDEGGPGTRQ
jgi:hypothetical protein